MGNFRQTRLPKRWQKKVNASVETFGTLKKCKQQTLKQCGPKWIEVNRPLITCDICAKENTHQWGKCCLGLKWCFDCDLYMLGLCPICEKDELNAAVHCDICAGPGNTMTVRRCCADAATGCTMDVCQQCSRQLMPYDKSYHFCSVKHYFQFRAWITNQPFIF